MWKFPRLAGKAPLALSVLLVLMLLPACGTFAKRSKATAPPQVSCEEHAPAEPAPETDGNSEDWRYWYRKALEWAGVATAEVQKRVTTAECMDGLRKSGVIR